MITSWLLRSLKRSGFLRLLKAHQWSISEIQAAYNAFATGKAIFDISPNAELLEEFAERNASEFYGDQIERGPDGKFRSMIFDPGAPRVFFTYHKHKAREVLVKELQGLERQNPALCT